MEIKVGKEYMTRGGQKVIIYATDAGGEYPIHGAVVVDDGTKYVYEWDERGSVYDINEEYMDIVSEWVEQLVFDWDCLPKWADRCITMGRKGLWYCLETKPFIAGNSFWDNDDDGNCCIIPTSHIPKNYTGDWKDSLHENPKYK